MGIAGAIMWLVGGIVYVPSPTKPPSRVYGSGAQLRGLHSQKLPFVLSELRN